MTGFTHQTGAPLRTRVTPWQFLYADLVILILLGLAAINVPIAAANHRDGNSHNAKMHSSAAGQEEAACVQAGTSHNGWSDFRLNVRAKMYIDNPSQDWDGLASNKVYLDLPLLNGVAAQCTSFPNRASIPVELYMSHDTTVKDPNWWAANACGVDMACEADNVLVYNATFSHWDYRDSYIWWPERTLYLYTQYNKDGTHPWHNDYQRAFVISHEWGHVLGLADGVGTQCDLSIMHAGKGGCPINIFWPQQIDRDSVTTIANNG